MFLNSTKRRRITIDCDAVLLFILVVFILYTIINQIENHFVHIQPILLFEGEDCLVIKEERQRTLSSEITVEFVEDRTHITYCTRGVICQSLHEDGNSMRAISFVGDLLVITLVLTHRILDSTLDIVLRHILAFGIGNDSTQCRIVLWFWTACFHSNSNLFTNLCKCLSHVAPSLQLCCFTIFKCSSHILKILKFKNYLSSALSCFLILVMSFCMIASICLSPIVFSSS